MAAGGVPAATPCLIRLAFDLYLGAAFDLIMSHGMAPLAAPNGNA